MAQSVGMASNCESHASSNAMPIKLLLFHASLVKAEGGVKIHHLMLALSRVGPICSIAAQRREKGALSSC